MWSDAGCLRKPPGSEQSSSLKVRHTSFAIIGVVVKEGFLMAKQRIQVGHMHIFEGDVLSGLL